MLLGDDTRDRWATILYSGVASCALILIYASTTGRRRGASSSLPVQELDELRRRVENQGEELKKLALEQDIILKHLQEERSVQSTADALKLVKLEQEALGHQLKDSFSQIENLRRIQERAEKRGKRYYALLQPVADPAPNNKIRWSRIVHLDRRMYRQSSEDEVLEVIERGLYLVNVRYIYNKVTEIPRILALLINDCVRVQYAAPKFGCFGPTETLALEPGDRLSVEYYGDNVVDNVLENEGVTFSVVRL